MISACRGDRSLRGMPELPEAERARQQIERALGREIVAVDDSDTYVCRPHGPGEIAAALVGHTLTTANRRGKFLWAETDDDGPELGLHLGMAGRIVVDEEPTTPWDRFTLHFADGGMLALRDKRRLGRAADRARLHPRRPGRRAGIQRTSSASASAAGRWRSRHGCSTRSRSPASATCSPTRRSGRRAWTRARPRASSPRSSSITCGRTLRAATRSAISKGGVHTGTFIPHRKRGGGCPRCESTLERATIGGRTTFWCPACQPA